MTLSQGFHFWLGAELAKLAIGLVIAGIIITGFGLFGVVTILYRKFRRR